MNTKCGKSLQEVASIYFTVSEAVTIICFIIFIVFLEDIEDVDRKSDSNSSKYLM